MMDTVEFACTLTEILKSHNIEMDTDLVGNIYENYKPKYDNYTLLELVGILCKMDVEITCAWNKKALINMIERKNINIPIKTDPMQPTKWKHYRVRRSLDVIETEHMEFYDGSIIQMQDGEAYLIDTIVIEGEELISADLPEDEESSYKKLICIYLKNIKTEDESSMYIEEFMHNLDYEDVTILQDRNRAYFMNEEQKQFWTNFVRWM